MSTIFSKQILSDGLLLAVTGGQKKKFSNMFKLESIAIYYFGFIVRVSWT